MLLKVVTAVRDGFEEGFLHDIRGVNAALQSRIEPECNHSAKSFRVRSQQRTPSVSIPHRRALKPPLEIRLCLHHI